jgi:hypothetical protein
MDCLDTWTGRLNGVRVEIISLDNERIHEMKYLLHKLVFDLEVSFAAMVNRCECVSKTVSSLVIITRTKHTPTVTNDIVSTAGMTTIRKVAAHHLKFPIAFQFHSLINIHC